MRDFFDILVNALTLIAMLAVLYMVFFVIGVLI